MYHRKNSIHFSRILVLTSVAILIMVPYRTSFSYSLFSVNGIGEIVHPVDSRARGMGGTTIGVMDGNILSLVNPASIFSVTKTTVIVTALPEIILSRNQNYTNRFNVVHFPLIRLTFPLYYDVVVSAGATKRTCLDYNIYGESIPFENTVYSTSIESSGGINSLTGTITKSVTSKFAVGLTANYLFGSTDEVWTTDFEDDDYRNTIDSVMISYSGINFDAGILFRISNDFTCGFVFSTSCKLDAELTTAKQTALPITESHEFNYPVAYGLGTSYRMGRGILIAADFYHQQWDKFKIDNTETHNFVNTSRFSCGLEYQATADTTAPYWKRIPLRIGYLYNPWYYKTNNSQTNHEEFLTFGLGFPFRELNGMLDLSFEIGRRGEVSKNKIEETIFRFSVSILGQEKWVRKTE